MVASNEFWINRRVFVTGASGLVGSWLTRALLDRKAQVVAFIHHPDPQTSLYRSGDDRLVSIVQGNLEDYDALERAINKYEADTVFHLGAQAIVGVAHRSPLPTFEANIRGTYNLLEACRIHGDFVKRVVIASSDKAYGTHEDLPYTEDMALKGVYPYEVSKTCADLISQSYYHTYHLPVAIARCGNIFGGGDLNWSRIIPDTIRSCIQHTPLKIRSDGTFVRDYIYVKDVAQAYMRVAKMLDQPQIQGQAFNFSPFKPLAVLELAQHIRRIMGCEDTEIEIMNTAQGEILSQYLDSTKAKQLLNWEPSYDLDTGLRETIAWYQDYFKALNATQSSGMR